MLETIDRKFVSIVIFYSVGVKSRKYYLTLQDITTTRNTMLEYGRKIINAVFNRREKCPPICAGLETKVAADSGRSDIRMFEIGLSAQQYGDYEQGTRTSTQEAIGANLISIAKANGLFVPGENWAYYGDRKRRPSGESIVYLVKNAESVVKVRNPFAKNAIKQLHAQDIIYEHLVHNVLFPNSRYRFIGIGEDVDGVRVILSQRYLADMFAIPSQEDIDRYLVERLGLKPENRYFYGNDYLAVTDVSADSDNVLTDGEKLFFIDPIIKMKRPATEILSYYYELMPNGR